MKKLYHKEKILFVPRDCFVCYYETFWQTNENLKIVKNKVLNFIKCRLLKEEIYILENKYSPRKSLE